MSSLNNDANGRGVISEVATKPYTVSLATLFLSGVAIVAGCDAPKLGEDTAVKEPESVTGLMPKEGASHSILRHENRIVIDNVERVFMHRPGEYSIFVREGDSLTHYMLANHHTPTKIYDFTEIFGTHRHISVTKPVEILIDVKPGRANWVECNITQVADSFPFAIEAEIKIHLSSSQDVVGSGYQRQEGKATTEENTTVVR
jgi:hypothetical protein